MTDGLWDFLFSFSRMFKSLTLLSQLNRGTRQLLKVFLKPDLLNSRFADPFLMKLIKFFYKVYFKIDHVCVITIPRRLTLITNVP